MEEEPPKSTQIDTGGGNSIGGNVNAGGDFVGRNKIINIYFNVGVGIISIAIVITVISLIFHGELANGK